MIINIEQVPTAYINLDQDADKRKSMETVLSKFQTAIRVPGVERELGKSSEQAVAEAHLKALNIFPTTMTLILEDDCIPYSYRNTITVPDDADIVHLGLFGKPWIIKNVDDDVARVALLNGAHAILYVTERGKDQLRWAVEQCLLIDHWHDCLLSRRLGNINAYALKKPIFAQSSKLNQSWMEIE